MKHLRVFESEGRYHWKVPGVEKNPAEYRAQSDGESARIATLLSRSGMTGTDGAGVVFNQYDEDDYCRLLGCEVCDGDGSVPCHRCGGRGCDACGQKGKVECPHAHTNGCKTYLNLNRTLLVSVDKFHDDYWLLKINLFDIEIDSFSDNFSDLHIKCDGLRGLEKAFDNVVAPRVRMLDEMNDLVTKAFDLEAGVQLNG